MASISSITDQIAKNDPLLKKVSFAAFATKMSHAQLQAVADALVTSTVVEEVDLARVGLDDKSITFFVPVLENNTSITELDIGYNKIKAAGIKAIAGPLTANTTLREVRIHRQDADMGSEAENVLVALWETNTTLLRLYATLHDRSCNRANTAGEVRNKEIARRIATGREWMDLDPARQEEWAAEQEAKRKVEAEAAARLAAPIAEKVESTGGPYSFKELTCEKKFLPDDIDEKNKEASLNDEEFLEHFKMSREDFAGLPGWKKLNTKKELNLH